MVKFSRKSKNKHLNVKEDRISSLPAPLIHHILSYLNMREILQTSILSNTWRYLWLSAPTLNLIFREWKPDLSSDAGFLHVVDNVIRRGTSSIEKLHLHYILELSTVDVHGWLLLALARNVQHLILHLACLDEFLELPRELFTLSITQLEVHSLRECLIGLPNTVCNAARVKSLVLINVELPDGNDKGELILSCPVLEHLTIIDCGISHLKMLSISTPLLETLKLKYLSRMKNASCTVKISTPTLKKFRVSSKVSPHGCNVHYRAENLSSLVKAYVDIYSSPEDSVECLIEVLKMVSNVQDLEVTGNSIKVLERFPNLLERLPGMFPNLRYVMFVDGCEIWSMNRFLSLLEKLPHAETFVWNRNEICWSSPFREKVKDWEPNLPHQSIFSCLKRFEIWNFRGTEAEQKFLKFLLERAFFLEEVVIEKSSGMGKK